MRLLFGVLLLTQTPIANPVSLSLRVEIATVPVRLDCSEETLTVNNQTQKETRMETSTNYQDPQRRAKLNSKGVLFCWLPVLRSEFADFALEKLV